MSLVADDMNDGTNKNNNMNGGNIREEKQFLVNVLKDEVNDVVSILETKYPKWNYDPSHKEFVVDVPKKNDEYLSWELEEKGYVGIYVKFIKN